MSMCATRPISGIGGPWKDSALKAGEPSDPYLMTGYDDKRLTLSHSSDSAVTFRVELDATGSGEWQNYRSFEVKRGAKMTQEFPQALHAYWMRVVVDRPCIATAQCDYR